MPQFTDEKISVTDQLNLESREDTQSHVLQSSKKKPTEEREKTLTQLRQCHASSL